MGRRHRVQGRGATPGPVTADARCLGAYGAQIETSGLSSHPRSGTLEPRQERVERGEAEHCAPFLASIQDDLGAHDVDLADVARMPFRTRATSGCEGVLVLDRRSDGSPGSVVTAPSGSQAIGARVATRGPSAHAGIGFHVLSRMPRLRETEVSGRVAGRHRFPLARTRPVT